MKILMLAYPGMTPLDLMGPLQVWNECPKSEIQIVWKNTQPITTDTPLAVVPTHDFDHAFTHPDILFVPGGSKATMDLMSDSETIAFLRSRGTTSKWITSVCTGALVLGAAGLLQGYKATTHWAAIEDLKQFGATPTAGRYVIDGNRATGGGVTAGIDFGLALVAEIEGEEMAKTIQLALEYSPMPPFMSGTPSEASDKIVKQVQEAFTAKIA